MEKPTEGPCESLNTKHSGLFFFFFFIYLFVLPGLSLHCYTGFSLVVVTRAALAVMRRFLTAVASLAGSPGSGAPGI